MSLRIKSRRDWSLDQISIDLTSRHEKSIDATLISYRPTKAIKKLSIEYDKEWEYQYHPTVDDLKKMAIIEGNLLPYTQSFYNTNLIIDSMKFFGFGSKSYGDEYHKIQCSVSGRANHAALPRESNDLLDFAINFTVSQDFVNLLLEFIKINIGDPHE